MKNLLLIALSLFLVNCASQQIASNGGNSDLVSTSGYTLRHGELYDKNGVLIPRLVYFALDSYQVGLADRQNLQAHARFLQAEPQVTVRVEGHGDERGSREYNLALGERRAYSVANILKGFGVADSKIRSYGEERPAAVGNNESVWQKNRRVEIFY